MAAVTFKPSRTFALAAFGLLVLTLIGLGLFIALGWTLANPTAVLEGTVDTLPGHLVQALQVVAGCVATVAGAGAGSMAARDFGSRGLTSSQAHQVLAARPRARGPAPTPPPRAPQAGTPEDEDPQEGQ